MSVRWYIKIPPFFYCCTTFCLSWAFSFHIFMLLSLSPCPIYLSTINSVCVTHTISLTLPPLIVCVHVCVSGSAREYGLCQIICTILPSLLKGLISEPTTVKIVKFLKKKRKSWDYCTWTPHPKPS